MKIKIIEPAREPQKLPFNPLNNDELATISGGKMPSCANTYEPQPVTPEITIPESGEVYSGPITGGGRRPCGPGMEKIEFDPNADPNAMYPGPNYGIPPSL